MNKRKPYRTGKVTNKLPNMKKLRQNTVKGPDGYMLAPPSKEKSNANT